MAPLKKQVVLQSKHRWGARCKPHNYHGRWDKGFQRIQFLFFGNMQIHIHSILTSSHQPKSCWCLQVLPWHRVVHWEMDLPIAVASGCHSNSSHVADLDDTAVAVFWLLDYMIWSLIHVSKRLWYDNLHIHSFIAKIGIAGLEMANSMVFFGRVGDRLVLLTYDLR